MSPTLETIRIRPTFFSFLVSSVCLDVMGCTLSLLALSHMRTLLDSAFHSYSLFLGFFDTCAARKLPGISTFLFSYPPAVPSPFHSRVVRCMYVVLDCSVNVYFPFFLHDRTVNLGICTALCIYQLGIIDRIRYT